MSKIEIEYLPIDKIKPYENNTRKHTDIDVRKIANSIRQFGFDDPIGVWSDKNIVVEGHGRLLAAQMLGMDFVPVIHLDHLTDEQRRAYAIAHNKIAELSEWDQKKLEKELNDFSFDMSDFGFWEQESKDKRDSLPKQDKNSLERKIVCPRCGSERIISAR